MIKCRNFLNKIFPVLLFLFVISPLNNQASVGSIVITPENLENVVEIPIEQEIFLESSKLVFYPSEISFDVLESLQNSEDSDYIHFYIALLDSDLGEKPRFLYLDDLVFSPDRTLAAAAYNVNEISILDMETHQLINSFKIETDSEPLNTIAIDPQNRYLAVTVGGTELYPLSTSIFQLFDLSSGEKILSLDRLTSNADEIYASGAVFDLDGEHVYLSTSDGVVRKWNISTQEIQIIGREAQGGYDQLVYHVTSQILAFFTSNGLHIISSDGQTDQFLVDPDSRQGTEYAISIATHPSEPLLAVAYNAVSKNSPNQPQMSMSEFSFIQIWNLESYEMSLEILLTEISSSSVMDIAFSEDGTLLGSVSLDGTVRLWGIPAGEGD